MKIVGLSFCLFLFRKRRCCIENYAFGAKIKKNEEFCVG
jgi:hypothetical protein